MFSGDPALLVEIEHFETLVVRTEGHHRPFSPRTVQDHRVEIFDGKPGGEVRVPERSVGHKHTFPVGHSRADVGPRPFVGEQQLAKIGCDADSLRRGWRRFRPRCQHATERQTQDQEQFHSSGYFLQSLVARAVDVFALLAQGIVSSLIAMDRNDEATAELRNQGTMEMVSRTSCVEHLINRAELARRNELVEMAQQDLVDALPIAKAHGLPMIESDVHRALCDLAQQRGDFALYINHSNEQRRINDEIHGRQAIQRLATLEVERKAEAERRDREKERQLLYGALPQNVVERLVRGEKVTGDHFADASVLIADVVGFTSHSADMHPNDVVLLLEQLFAELDSVCDEYSITKVKTIGDAYLCFKGDRDAYTNANAVVTMAKKVVQMSFSWPNGDPIILRIGIHSGPITAGVIGSLRLQYDVWGDTVNMTSRLESTAEAGKIHVSHDLVSCFTLDVKHNNQESVPSPLHSFSPRGHVALKGKGVVATYWVDA